VLDLDRNLRSRTPLVNDFDRQFDAAAWGWRNDLGRQGLARARGTEQGRWTPGEYGSFVGDKLQLDLSTEAFAIHMQCDRIGVVVAPNFSLTIALVRRLSAIIARFAALDEQRDPYVFEHHQARKKDAPSGTARRFATLRTCSVSWRTTTFRACRCTTLGPSYFSVRMERQQAGARSPETGRRAAR